MEKELNKTFVILLFLAVAINAIAIIPSLISIFLAYEGLVSFVFAIWSFVTRIAAIGILIGISMVKRWALYAYGGFHIINVVVLSIIQGDWLLYLIGTLVMCAIMAGLLCLRNNGISGWNLFFASESELASEAENAVSVNETITKTDDKEE